MKAQSPMTHQRIILIGTGFAGLSFLNRLLKSYPREATPSISVSVITNNPFFEFTGLMPDALTQPSIEERARIRLSMIGYLRDPRVQIINQAASYIDDTPTIRLAQGTILNYDILILAYGARPAYHDIPGAREHAYMFKHWEDLDDLEIALNKPADDNPIAIIGGGPTGIELAFAINQWRAVHIIEAKDILQGCHAAYINKVKKRLKKEGITLRTSCEATAVDDTGITTSTGEKIQGKVIWCAGVEVARLGTHPSSGPAGWEVDEHLRVKGNTTIYAMGDCASGHPKTAQSAMAQGHYVAQQVIRHLRSERAQQYHDINKGFILKLDGHDAIMKLPRGTLAGRLPGYLRKRIYNRRLKQLAE
jgi:NADH dehydrogenase FAD-containing subunit